MKDSPKGELRKAKEEGQNVSQVRPTFAEVTKSEKRTERGDYRWKKNAWAQFYYGKRRKRA